MQSSRETITIDPQFAVCPIAYELCRYPVLASDGYRYELYILLAQIKEKGLISPMTRQPITFVIFDQQLQNSLDLHPDLERFTYDDKELWPDGYTEENKKADLAELIRLVEAPQKAANEGPRKSVMVGGTVGSIALLLYANSFINSFSLAPYLAIATAMVDYQTRYFTNYRHGFFSGAMALTKNLVAGYHEYFQQELDERTRAYWPTLDTAQSDQPSQEGDITVEEAERRMVI